MIFKKMISLTTANNGLLIRSTDFEYFMNK